MYRKLAGIVLTAASMNASYLQALGLGEMTMHSALHQPLSAEIRLTNVGDLSPDQIKIRLASNKEFQLAGIDRVQFLNGMTFKVHKDKNGNALVKVTTTRNVKEPFLDFLVEAKWPTGKVIRSYTALVDLPVFKSDARQVVKQSVKPSSSNTYKQGDSNNNVSDKASSFTYNTPETTSKSVSDPASDTGYRVKNNDTLWEIARAMKPGAGFTVQQTMLAIQKLNPRAFPDDNINKLRAGSVLRMPSTDDVKKFTAAQAVTLVSEQNNQWMKSGLDATEDKSVYTKPDAGAEGHLVLSSSGSGDSDGVEDTQNVAENTAPASQINDELASTKLENDELTTKVEALNEQIDDLNRLIMLKDGELAALQQQLADQAALKQDAPVQVAEPEATNIADDTILADNTDAEQPAASIMHFLKGIEPVYFGGFALFILAIVVALLLQRREKAEKQALKDACEFEFGNLDKPFVAPNMAEEIVPDDQPAPVNAEELIESTLDDDEIDETEVLSVKLETDDALGEADIYVAYGRYKQAIELLQGAITANGDNPLLRNKILDVYLESNDKEGFRQQFFESRDLGYDSVIHHAKDILSSSDQTDWLSSLETKPSETTAVVDDEPLDTDLTELFQQGSDNTTIAETAPTLLDSVADFEPTFNDSTNNDSTNEQDLQRTDAPASVQGADHVRGVDATTDNIDLPDLDINLDDINEPVLSSDQAPDTLELANPELDTLNLAVENDDLVTSEDGLISDEAFFMLDETEPEEPATSNESHSTADDTLEIDLSDFGLLMDQASDHEPGSATGQDADKPAQSLTQTRDEKTESHVAGDVQDAAIEQGLDRPLASVSTLAIPEVTITDEMNTANDFTETNESLDESIEALVKLSEDSLMENAESAFIDNDEDDEMIRDELQESDLAYITGADEVATKLDLARAYIDMGDLDGARGMLVEVIQEGGEQQKVEATELMDSVQ